MKNFIKVFLICLIGFSIVIGTGVYIYLNYEDEQKQKDVKMFELDDKENKERVNVLLLGIDSLDGEKKTVGEPTRTDTMMLLSMDLATKSAFILSIPRDSRVQIDGREKPERINHAYAYGGIELSLKTVKQTLQIPIHHYIRVDYNALYKTVDDLGGIQIDVPMDMYYEDLWAKPPITIDLKKGYQTLDSDKAIQFLRFRHGYADQDLGRIKSQQKFLDSLIRKVLSPVSITKIPDYIETMYMYVNTDMSKKEILSFSKTAIRINPDNIEKQTLAGEPKNLEASYYIIDEESVKAQLDYLLSGNYNIQPIGEEREEITIIAPNRPIIAIYNGSGYKNIARRASDLLKIDDIQVNSTANAGSFDNEETHIYYKGDRVLAKQIKNSLGMGLIIEGTGAVDYTEPDIVVILGKDFKNK